MAKPRLTVALFVDTEQHATAILTGINQRLSGRAVYAVDAWEQHRAEDVPGQRVAADVRLETETDRDAVRDSVLAALEHNPEWGSWILRGSRVTEHLCTHDEGEARRGCKEVVVWSK